MALITVSFQWGTRYNGYANNEDSIVISAGEGAQYFRFKPRNSSVLEGGEVIIPCEVENRVGIVQWVKDGFAYVIQTNGDIVGHPRLRLIGEQDKGFYNLKITDASLTDDGEYQCQVGPYLRIKPIRANAHLIVICSAAVDGGSGGARKRKTEDLSHAISMGCTREKIEEYIPLAQDIRRIWKQEQILIIPLIISATEIKPINFKHHQNTTATALKHTPRNSKDYHSKNV
ncbi:hypothetical protein M0802_002515 [Mischocyttarus mexicanus]|nr:hypothetical protein M0802_002515 [Mischocyttarus mexicanus]